MVTSTINYSHITRQEFEQLCVMNARVEFENPAVAKCRIIDNYIYADVRDRALAPHLMRIGLWEPWISVAFMHDIKPGDKFLDVGANFGWYSMLAKMMRAEVVGAVEASKEVSYILGLTFGANKIKAPIFNYAAWSKDDELVYLANDVNNQGGASVLTAPETRRQQGEKVLTKTLDYFNAGWPIDVVKIDVESAEMEVWRGMSQIRRQNQDLRVWMEFTPCGHSDPWQALNEIRNDGFEIQEVNLDGDLIKRDISEIVQEKDWVMLYLRRPR